MYIDSNAATYERHKQRERVNVSLVVVRHRESNLWGHVARRTRAACEFEGVVWLPGLWKLRSEPKVKDLDIVPDIEPDILWFLSKDEDSGVETSDLR